MKNENTENVTIKVYSRIIENTRWFDRQNDQYFVCAYATTPLSANPRFSACSWADIVPRPEQIQYVEKLHPGCTLVYNAAGMERDKLMSFI